MIFDSQNLMQVHVAYSFHELFIFFWLTLVVIFKRNTDVITYSKGKNKCWDKKQRDTLSPVSDINVEKANESVYIAKSRQRYHKTLNNILLHVSNHALKCMYMVNYGTMKKTVSIIVPSRG